MSAAAGVEISLRIGQRVRHHDFHGKRVTGVVRGLCIEEDVLHADIVLDDALVIPPINADDHELRIYRQHVPAHELAPFDERDEVINELVRELKHAAHWFDQITPADAERYRAAIAKATGSAT
jgi:hypothetical protein